MVDTASVNVSFCPERVRSDLGMEELFVSFPGDHCKQKGFQIENGTNHLHFPEVLGFKNGY